MSEKKYIFGGILLLAVVFVFSFNGWGMRLLASLVGVSGGSRQPAPPKEDTLFYEIPLFDSLGQIYGTEVKQFNTGFEANGKPESIFRVNGELYGRADLAALSLSDIYEQSVFDNQADAVGVIVELEEEPLLEIRTEAVKLTKSTDEIERLLEKQKNQISKEHDRFKKYLETVYKKSLGGETDTYQNSKIRIREFKNAINGFAVLDVAVADVKTKLAGFSEIKKIVPNERIGRNLFSSIIAGIENCADPDGDADLSDIEKFCVAAVDGATDTPVAKAKLNATANGISFRTTVSDSELEKANANLDFSKNKIDLGLDFNAEKSWSAEGKLTITNKTNIPATYSVSLDCCRQGGVNFSKKIKFEVGESSVTLSPRTPQEINFRLSIPANSDIPNGRYNGFLKFSGESLGLIKIPVTFFKGYGLRISYSGGSPDALLLYRGERERITVFPHGKNQTIFYLTSPGLWFVESVWPDEEEGVVNRHVIKSNIQLTEPITSITLDKNEASHVLTMKLINPSGKALSFTPPFVYKFSHRASGHGLDVIVPAGFRGNQIKIKVSSLSSDYNFAAAASQNEDNAIISYLYQIKDGIKDSIFISNLAKNFVVKDLVAFQNRLSKQSSYVYIGDCVTDYRINGATGYGCAYFADRNIGIGSNQFRKIYIFNSSPRDLTARRYPDNPSFNFLLATDKTQKFFDKSLYRSPQYYIIGENVFAWLRGGFEPTSRALSNVYQTFKVDVSSSNILSLGNSPVFDTSRWYNFADSDNRLSSAGGSNTPLYLWGSYADEKLTKESVAAGKLTSNYSLKRGGEPVLSGKVGLNDGIVFTEKLLPGNYEFEMKREVTINDVATVVNTVSTFNIVESNAYRKKPVDENPPYLTGFAVSADGFPQNVIDTTLTNKVVFGIEPAAGLKTQNSAGNYELMADALSSAKFEVTYDGVVWRERALTELGGGKFSAVLNVPGDPMPPNQLVSFRIFAQDLAKNTLTLITQMPTGSGFKDKEMPHISFVSPSTGDVAAGNLNIQVLASDNTDIAKVDFYKNEEIIASKTAAPFNFSWDTRGVADGDYILSAKAYDSAGNEGFSQKVKIKVDNTPPLVFIDSPSEGSIVGGTIVNIFGNVTDDTAVSKVDFYVDDKALGFDNNFPYILSWDSTSVPDGKHALYLKAADDAGNVSISNQISVIVENKRRGTTISTPPVTPPSTTNE